MTEQGIVVVGGGIAGLAFALSLHQRGIACDVYESVPQVKELGVGPILDPFAPCSRRRLVCSHATNS
jgi:2-polyprenyl-6-methoxyphenol hydroxylase-like FAD-dependent oxidoreductase